jgi:pimeloyl-ACP methyl ester carboxylesterase
LERQFTVYVVDRRGRGESGDSPTYSIEREFEDVAAVVDSVDQPVNLLGHSYGGICSMEASLLTKNVRKLILYEPPVPIPGVQIYPTGIVDKLQALKEQGNKEAVLTTFLREIVRMPSHELDLLQSQPAWSGRVAAAHTIPRELQAHQAYKFKAERFSNVRTPTMLLLGGDSPHFFKTAVELVKAALPSSQVVVLPGQQHVADQTAPELFLREVLRFLT